MPGIAGSRELMTADGFDDGGKVVAWVKVSERSLAISRRGAGERRPDCITISIEMNGKDWCDGLLVLPESSQSLLYPIDVVRNYNSGRSMKNCGPDVT